MDREETLTALRRLRDGRDPATDEPLAPDHAFQRADVVRVLFAAVAALEAGSCPPPGTVAAAAGDAPAVRPPRPRPPRAGQPWSDEDDRNLTEAFDGGADERELAAAFGRSRASIRARLMRLGRGPLLDPGPAPRYPVVEPAPDLGVEEVGHPTPA